MREMLKVLKVFVSIFVLNLFLSCSNTHPKDADLIANFQNHKEGFNKLVRMFQEDRSLGRIANDFIRKNNYEGGSPKMDGKETGISDQRLMEYRKLFNQLGLTAGMEGYGDKADIWFHASANGLAVSGSGKGYVLMFEKPAPEIVVDSLDEYAMRNASTVAYRHIEGNWYLYYAAD